MEQDRSKEPRPDDLRPEEVKAIFQEGILRNYPNPERKGCPGNAVLNEMAKAHLPFEHPKWSHVTHCSPCYGEFLACRHGFLKGRRLRHRFARVAAGATFIVLASGALLMWKGRNPPRHPTVPIEEVQTQQQPESPSRQIAIEVTVDIQGATPVRGATSRSRKVSVRVPISVVKLRMKLPLGSAEGGYDVQIKRSLKGDILRRAHGNAATTNGDTWLTVEVDFSEMREGTYLLLYRHGGTSWHPVLISVTK